MPHGAQAIAIDVPYTINVLRHRARQSEQTRLRCLSRNCPHRDEADKRALVTDPPPFEELAEDDREATAFEVEPTEAESVSVPEEDDTVPPGLPGATQAEGRDYLIDLWPFARPKGASGENEILHRTADSVDSHSKETSSLNEAADSQGYYHQIFDEVLKATGCKYVCVISASAHPSPWLAARQMGCDSWQHIVLCSVALSRLGSMFIE